MDPKTGQFHRIDELARIVESVGAPKDRRLDRRIPKDWPCFTEGEVVNVKGHPFRIVKVKAARCQLVLRPTAVEGHLDKNERLPKEK